MKNISINLFVSFLCFIINANLIVKAEDLCVTEEKNSSFYLEIKNFSFDRLYEKLKELESLKNEEEYPKKLEIVFKILECKGDPLGVLAGFERNLSNCEPETVRRNSSKEYGIKLKQALSSLKSYFYKYLLDFSLLNLEFYNEFYSKSSLTFEECKTIQRYWKRELEMVKKSCADENEFQDKYTSTLRWLEIIELMSLEEPSFPLIINDFLLILKSNIETREVNYRSNYFIIRNLPG